MNRVSSSLGPAFKRLVHDGTKRVVLNTPAGAAKTPSDLWRIYLAHTMKYIKDNPNTSTVAIASCFGITFGMR